MPLHMYVSQYKMPLGDVDYFLNEMDMLLKVNENTFKGSKSLICFLNFFSMGSTFKEKNLLPLGQFLSYQSRRRWGSTGTTYLLLHKKQYLIRMIKLRPCFNCLLPLHLLSPIVINTVSGSNDKDNGMETARKGKVGSDLFGHADASML